MFKGLHQMLSRTAAQQESTKHPHAMPVETAAVLLAPSHRQEHLKNIKSLLHLPPKLYDTLYFKVIERFAEFVQNLPETEHGAFSQNGGFLDHGLERASRALTLCLSYFFPDEKSFHSITSEQALWIYAVFTAGLLLDVGKLVVKYQVTLCNKDGSAIKEWLPYSGPMLGQAKFYKYTYVKQNRDHLRRLINSLLARQLLTEADAAGDGTTTIGGFNWIASNPTVLEAWLNMLYGDTRNVTSYLTVLPYADLLAIQNQLEQEKAANTGKNALFGTNLFDTKDNPLAAEFAAAMLLQDWIRENIANGNLSFNQADSLIHGTEDGLLISTDELINRFLNANDERVQNFLQQNPSQGLENLKEQLIALMGRCNIPISQQANEYVNLKGSVAGQTFRNWQLVHKPEFLVQIGQKIPVNTDIAKIPVQQQNTSPIHTPAEPKQQRPHAKL